jgi:hypothetical protein
LVVNGSPLPNGEYFRQSWFVFSLVYPNYLDSREFLMYDPLRLRYPDGIIHSRFDVSHTAFASPPYWRGANPPDDLSLYVGMRVSQAAFPSSKGLLYDQQMSLQLDLASRRGEYGPWLISRVDGSAFAERYDPSYEQPSLRPYGAAPIPGMMTTVDGFEGRDF